MHRPIYVCREVPSPSESSELPPRTLSPKPNACLTARRTFWVIYSGYHLRTSASALKTKYEHDHHLTSKASWSRRWHLAEEYPLEGRRRTSARLILGEDILSTSADRLCVHHWTAYACSFLRMVPVASRLLLLPMEGFQKGRTQQQ